MSNGIHRALQVVTNASRTRQYVQVGLISAKDEIGFHKVLNIMKDESYQATGYPSVEAIKIAYTDGLLSRIQSVKELEHWLMND